MTIDHFSTATEMRAALAAGKVSSAELVEMHIARIDAHDGALNAIPVRTFDRARAAAAIADKKIAEGESGALLGVPMTFKESTQTAGLPQSAGIDAFKDYKPVTDGVLASRSFDAGTCLLGKTNIPVALGDWQADSPVYGRTNNPWDLSRTPGGSTGGGGAALAAGMTPIEIGSDIGGSIRVPAAYCGVYGHRPSETAIPQTGAFPLADLPNPAFRLGVQGPLARSATDIELLFNVLAGPDIGEDAAWRLDLRPPRHDTLSGFRVGVMPSVLGVSPSNAMHARLDELVHLLSKEGAKVTEAQAPFDIDAYFRDYLRLLTTMVSQGRTRADREESAKEMRAAGDPRLDAQADGLDMDAHAFMELVGRRSVAQLQWRGFFNDYDVVIAPMVLDAAFPHQEAPDFKDRILMVDNEALPYINNIIFPMIAIFAGLPSTAFPAGLDPQGLPLGLQAIGPYLEDRTTIRFAQLIERAWYKFQPPPGY